MYAAGIDPGAMGALAVVSSDLSDADAWLYPGEVSLAAHLLRTVCNDYRPNVFVLEHVRSMPGQGVVSMFSFGRSFGAWEGLLAGMGMPWIYVTPQTWQRKLLDPGAKGTTKERSVEMARRLFPAVDLHRKKDQGKADALHLARWGLIELRGTSKTK